MELGFGGQVGSLGAGGLASEQNLKPTKTKERTLSQRRPVGTRMHPKSYLRGYSYGPAGISVCGGGATRMRSTTLQAKEKLEGSYAIDVMPMLLLFGTTANMPNQHVDVDGQLASG